MARIECRFVRFVYTGVLWFPTPVSLEFAKILPLLLIPPQAVLRLHWRTDITSFTSPGTPAAVSRAHRLSLRFRRRYPIVSVATGSPRTCHQGIDLSRVSWLANINHAARALVRRSPLLVTSRH